MSSLFHEILFNLNGVRCLHFYSFAISFKIHDEMDVDACDNAVIITS